MNSVTADVRQLVYGLRPPRSTTSGRREPYAPWRRRPASAWPPALE
ncbi:hypothetical protein OHB01_23185 [Microbispora hainanensis]|uniref:Uncharacterized protein n=1 Tax=Microbispora hainanensis TaxID=568844 RepID=A0ABZ1STY4_9ACTN|nr:MULTISPECIES: hypothetical protein [Microbispora]